MGRWRPQSSREKQFPNCMKSPWRWHAQTRQKKRILLALLNKQKLLNEPWLNGSSRTESDDYRLCQPLNPRLLGHLLTSPQPMLHWFEECRQRFAAKNSTIF